MPDLDRLERVTGAGYFQGDSLVVICIPLNNRPNRDKFGYTWIKNNHLLKETPGKEVWEDLYLSHYNDVANTGIILEITDIQVWRSPRLVVRPALTPVPPVRRSPRRTRAR